VNENIIFKMFSKHLKSSNSFLLPINTAKRIKGALVFVQMATEIIQFLSVWFASLCSPHRQLQWACTCTCKRYLSTSHTAAHVITPTHARFYL